MSTRDDWNTRHPTPPGRPPGRPPGNPASPPPLFTDDGTPAPDIAGEITLSGHGRIRTARSLNPEQDLTARFLAFHQAHPDVYQRLRVLALEGRRAGRTRGSIAMLYEVVRWEGWLLHGIPDEGEHRLNNSYRSRYARLIMEAEPDLAGFFDTRELHTT
jgi:hypothetical protein